MERPKTNRQKYYAAENELRRLKRQAARKPAIYLCRPCPTGEEVLLAWRGRQTSREGFLGYLSTLLDLHMHLDSAVVLVPGAGGIRGRGAGLLGWLPENVPELQPRYKTLMRHMRLAVDLARVLSLRPAIPLVAVLSEATVRHVHDRQGLDWLRKNFYASFEKLPPTPTAYARRVAELLPHHDQLDAWRAAAEFRRLKRERRKRLRSQNSQA